MSSLRLFLIFSYIFLFTVSAHPMIYGNALVDTLGDARQIAKRTLASGRWGLRPGKRSMMIEPNYDYDPLPQQQQQQQQIFTDPSQAIYHLWLLA
uniref:Uncharacterized protein n=1 Tax=Panagrolaimus superbus TaxID=310955 RepID=A0A914Y3H2_9BILA